KMISGIYQREIEAINYCLRYITLTWIFLFFFQSLGQAQAVVGKIYWPIGESNYFRQLIGSDVRWIRILTADEADSYGLQYSDGRKLNLSKASVDDAIWRGFLIDYDPVAKAAAQRASEQKRAAAAREAHIKLVNSKPWPLDIKNAVIEKRVLLGMTSEQ